VNVDDRQAIALVNAGADPNTPYKAARIPSLLEFVTKWLQPEDRPITNWPTSDTHSAFMIACGAPWNNDEAIMAQSIRTDVARLVEAMLSHGANVNAKMEGGWTPLMWAVTNNYTQTVDVLLKQGACVNVPDDEGCTPLIYAAMRPASLDLVRLLLQHGSEVNAQDDIGCTALQWAVASDAPVDVVTLLLTHGADPNLADNLDGTPLMRAQEWERRPDLVALLKQYGAKEPRRPHE